MKHSLRKIVALLFIFYGLSEPEEQLMVMTSDDVYMLKAIFFCSGLILLFMKDDDE